MNPTKFGSPHLDTPNSRYDFCKFATKSMKTNKENHSKIRNILHTPGLYTHCGWQQGPTVNVTPCDRHIEQGHGLTGDKLIDGVVTGILFPTLLRIDWYPWLARWITEATSPATMAARRRCSAAGSSSPMTIRSGKCATVSGGPCRALGLGLGHDRAAVCSGRAHGGTAAHSARR